NFSSAWIDDPGYLRMDFEEFVPGQTVPTTAGAIVDKTGYGLAATASNMLRVVPGRGGEGRTAAVVFPEGGASIRIDDGASRGRLNFDRDASFAIRVVFRTTSHATGGTMGSGAL